MNDREKITLGVASLFVVGLGALFRRRRQASLEKAPPVDDWGTLLSYREIDNGFDRGVSWRLYLQPDGKGCVRMRYSGGKVGESFAVAREVCDEIVKRHGAENMSTPPAAGECGRRAEGT